MPRASRPRRPVLRPRAASVGPRPKSAPPYAPIPIAMRHEFLGYFLKFLCPYALEFGTPYGLGKGPI